MAQWLHCSSSASCKARWGSPTSTASTRPPPTARCLSSPFSRLKRRRTCAGREETELVYMGEGGARGRPYTGASIIVGFARPFRLGLVFTTLLSFAGCERRESSGGGSASTAPSGAAKIVFIPKSKGIPYYESMYPEFA